MAKARVTNATEMESEETTPVAENNIPNASSAPNIAPPPESSVRDSTVSSPVVMPEQKPEDSGVVSLKKYNNSSSLYTGDKGGNKFLKYGCMVPRFLFQVFFSIPSFIGMVVGVIVVILMATVIIIFSVESRAAVDDVSLSVRDLSITSVSSHLDKIFSPLVISTLAASQFRINFNMTETFSDRDNFARMLYAIALQNPVSLFCADHTGQNAFGVNNLVDLLITPGQISTWTLNGSAPGELSYLKIDLLNNFGAITKNLLPDGLSSVDNIATPYWVLLQALPPHEQNISSFTPLERDQVSNDFFVSYVIGFYVNSIFQFCWSSLNFGNSVSQYLQSSQQFPHALMLLIERNGYIIASSDTSRVPNVLPNQQRLSMSGVNETDIREGYAQLLKLVNIQTLSTKFRFQHGSTYFDVVPYTGPASSVGINWLVVVAIPEDDILGKVIKSQNITLGVSIGILVAGLILAYFTSFCITLPLFQIKSELQRVSKLELKHNTPVFCRLTFLSEIRALSLATSKLKSGLQSFERYVPSSVVRMILRENRAAKLGMEQRMLTAFFSDIVQFTSIAETEDPHQLVSQLEVYFTLFSATLQKYDLTLISYIGDAVFAFATEDQNAHHHANTCHCALDIQDNLKSMNDEWKQQGKPMLETRIGLHTGNALVGNIGSNDRFAWTAIGDTINLSSRLEGVNKLYKTFTICSEATVNAVRQSGLEVNAVFVPMDIVAVKGMESKTAVYQVCRSREAAAPSGYEGDSSNVIPLYESIVSDYRKGSYAEVMESMRKGGHYVLNDHRLAPLREKTEQLLDGYTGEDLDKLFTK